MKTSECAKLAGISVDTLRYYEKYGLIKPKKEGYSREYTTEDIEQLKYIAIFKAVGMKLSDIKLINDMDEVNIDYETIKALLESYLEKVEKQEEMLKYSKNILTRALNKVKGVLK